MEKINDEIVGGLISALSRKESLEKAMMTFYNAGYEKEEIEISARKVYDKLGPQAMGVKGPLQEAFDEISTKAGVENKGKPKEEKKERTMTDEDIALQPLPDKEEFEKANANKSKVPLNTQQNFSNYGQNSYNPEQYKNAEEITTKIESAIKGLQGINIPSRIEIVRKDEHPKTKTVVQHVSHYSEPPKKYASKAITYVLIVVLILLLIALGAVFLFREDLIKIFNTLGLS